jgi:hypothetical protein
MIDLVGAIFKTSVQGLNFVERFSPYVRPLSRSFETGSGDNLQFITQTYPIAAEVNDRYCWENNKHLFLVPDAAKSSVCWFEDRGNGTITRTGAKSSQLDIVQPVRFSCWLNLAKLGVHTNNTTPPNITPFQLAFAALLPRKNTSFTAQGITGDYQVTGYSILPQDPETIFDRYSFRSESWMFLSPYAFFGVEFTVQIRLNANCLDGVILGDEVECITVD